MAKRRTVATTSRKRAAARKTAAKSPRKGASIPGLNAAAAIERRKLDRRDRNAATVGKARKNQKAMSKDAKKKINKKVGKSVSGRTRPTSSRNAVRRPTSRRSGRGVVTVTDI